MSKLYKAVMKGVGGSLSLFATSEYKRTNMPSFHTDAGNLGKDFAQVGHGLRKAVKHYEQQAHYG